jgi:hypothetical protein
MTPERNNSIPAWSQRERWNDLAWIATHLPNFWSAASIAFAALGRGAIVVETAYHVPQGGHPAAYLTEEQIARYEDEDINRLITGYTPAEELVVILLKEQQRTSAYRLRAQLSDLE